MLKAENIRVLRDEDARLIRETRRVISRSRDVLIWSRAMVIVADLEADGGKLMATPPKGAGVTSSF